MCNFCKNKQFIPMQFRGEGIGTVIDNINAIFGRQDDITGGSGIQIVEDSGQFFLSYDNSADEYADGFAAINYCPICGMELKKEE